MAANGLTKISLREVMEEFGIFKNGERDRCENVGLRRGVRAWFDGRELDVVHDEEQRQLKTQQKTNRQQMTLLKTMSYR